ncbi:MAG: glycosyltransferase [Steroidobacteraceae bacterium]
MYTNSWVPRPNCANATCRPASSSLEASTRAIRRAFPSTSCNVRRWRLAWNGGGNAATWSRCWRRHIVCLPSYREGLPMALLEAAAAGKPMVATNVPGCREVVLEGITGLLVPPRQVLPLADCLQTLIGEPALRMTMGQAARRLCEAEFGVESVVRSSLELYEGGADAG